MYSYNNDIIIAIQIKIQNFSNTLDWFSLGRLYFSGKLPYILIFFTTWMV